MQWRSAWPFQPLSAAAAPIPSRGKALLGPGSLLGGSRPMVLPTAGLDENLLWRRVGGDGGDTAWRRFRRLDGGPGLRLDSLLLLLLLSPFLRRRARFVAALGRLVSLLLLLLLLLELLPRRRRFCCCFFCCGAGCCSCRPARRFLPLLESLSEALFESLSSTRPFRRRVRSGDLPCLLGLSSLGSLSRRPPRSAGSALRACTAVANLLRGGLLLRALNPVLRGTCAGGGGTAAWSCPLEEASA
mmetsp:Transcript_21076/g.34789  ORF Transcript_21076/g.34789 Transcript_21076/m.34789 type:complete len:244 (-) Transcript_21076:185-916(-)